MDRDSCRAFVLMLVAGQSARRVYVFAISDIQIGQIGHIGHTRRTRSLLSSSREAMRSSRARWLSAISKVCLPGQDTARTRSRKSAHECRRAHVCISEHRGSDDGCASARAHAANGLDRLLLRAGIGQEWNFATQDVLSAVADGRRQRCVRSAAAASGHAARAGLRAPSAFWTSIDPVTPPSIAAHPATAWVPANAPPPRSHRPPGSVRRYDLACSLRKRGHGESVAVQVPMHGSGTSPVTIHVPESVPVAGSNAPVSAASNIPSGTPATFGSPSPQRPPSVVAEN